MSIKGWEIKEIYNYQKCGVVKNGYYFHKFFFFLKNIYITSFLTFVVFGGEHDMNVLAGYFDNVIDWQGESWITS